MTERSTTDLLVCPVGHNPASVLVAAGALHPKVAILVPTDDTLSIAEALKAQLERRSPGIVCQTPASLRFARPPALVEMRDRARSVFSSFPKGKRAVLDLTGGTKAMAMGLWLALRDALGAEPHAVQLDPDGTLTDAEHGGAVPSEVLIPIDDVLAWRGAQVHAARWQGAPAAIPDTEVPFEALGRFLAHYLCVGGGFERVAATATEAARWVFPPGRVPRALAAFSDSNARAVYEPRPGYLGQGEWLEVECLRAVRAVARKHPHAALDAGLGVKLRSAAGHVDEADVVVCRGPRVLVIEAKGRGNALGAGDHLQKRIQKSRSYFDSRTRVIFVHPAWGAAGPPDSLRDVAGRDVELLTEVGDSLEVAIERALGL